MKGHKQYCLDYIRKEFGIQFPINENNRELKVDFAMNSPEGIICFEAEATTGSTNESPLHIMGHIFHQIMLNKDVKRISTFYWLVGPGEKLETFQTYVESLIEGIKPLLKDENILPTQKFDKIP
jgi:hypothetical protein